MKEELKKYQVRRVGGREITVPAKNSTEAKRKACRFWGVNPNDRWIGISSCSAKLIRS